MYGIEWSNISRYGAEKISDTELFARLERDGFVRDGDNFWFGKYEQDELRGSESFPESLEPLETDFPEECIYRDRDGELYSYLDAWGKDTPRREIDMENIALGYGHIYKLQPILWKIIDERDGVLTLLSSKALFASSFGECESYADSPIRKLLSERFYKRAFTPRERDMIIDTELENSIKRGEGYIDSPNTRDKVFLLSLEEAASIFEGRLGGELNSVSACYFRERNYSKYALATGVRKEKNENGEARCVWMLRSLGGSFSYAPVHLVGENGNINHHCDKAFLAGVVPAIRIKLN